MTVSEGGREDFAELDFANLNEDSFNSKITQNLANYYDEKDGLKLKKSAIRMRRYDEWMKKLRTINVLLQEGDSILKRISSSSDQEQQKSHHPEQSSFVKDNLDRIASLSECFSAIFILHEDEGKVPAGVRKKAFEQLKAAYGFDSKGDVKSLASMERGSGNDIKTINSLQHIVTFTRFLKRKIKESIGLFLNAESVISDNDLKKFVELNKDGWNAIIAEADQEISDDDEYDDELEMSSLQRSKVEVEEEDILDDFNMDEGSDSINWGSDK